MSYTDFCPMELDALEIAILKTLLYTESFATIIEECEVSHDANIVGDGLKSLLKHKLVRPMKSTSNGFETSLVYDSDKMHSFHYQATARGISWLENHSDL